MTRTPSPPPMPRTPPAPRWGSFKDLYEPYPTRQSARLASQRASQESPSTPPNFSESESEEDTKGARKHSDYGFPTMLPGPFDSSPRKKRVSDRAGLAKMQSLTKTSGPHNTSASSPSNQSSPSCPTTVTGGMLPTPAKTPKTPKKKAIGDFGSTARTLFRPTPNTGSNKKSKRSIGYSLESFEDDSNQSQANIEIYTDSRDRIPEVDESEDNPFYVKPSAVKASGKAAVQDPKGQTEEVVKRDKDVEKALDREDGMYYVFRGKKFFRKFADDADDCEDDDNDLGLFANRPDLLDPDTLAMINTPRRARSSFKPRFQIPTGNDEEGGETEEEEATDVEEHGPSKASKDADHTEDLDMQQDSASPPPNSSVATPTSPSASGRTLRSRAKHGGAEYVTPTSSPSKQLTSFGEWSRKKQSPPSGTLTPRKRDATTSSPAGSVTKKTKGNRDTLRS